MERRGEHCFSFAWRCCVYQLRPSELIFCVLPVVAVLVMAPWCPPWCRLGGSGANRPVTGAREERKLSKWVSALQVEIRENNPSKNPALLILCWAGDVFGAEMHQPGPLTRSLCLNHALVEAVSYKAFMIHDCDVRPPDVFHHRTRGTHCWVRVESAWYSPQTIARRSYPKTSSQPILAQPRVWRNPEHLQPHF